MRGLPVRILVALTTAGMIAANLMANALPFFGRDTADVSARFPTLVTPAGYVFAIWGLIYLGLVALSVAQFLEPLRHDELPDRIAVPLIVSNVANITWLLLWHSLQIVWTVPVMLVLLASLVAAYTRAHRDRPQRPSALELWCVRAPLGLYLGWISVATIANVSAALVGVGWNGLGIPAEVWSLAVLAVATALALAGLWRKGDTVFALVFVWALVGIKLGSASAVVGWIAIGLAVGIAAATLATVAVRQRFI